jgi:hypothetical protein
MIDDEGGAGGGGAGFFSGIIAAPVLRVVETGRRVFDTVARHISEHRRINLERDRTRNELQLRRDELNVQSALGARTLDEMVRLRRDEMEERRRILQAIREDEWRRLRFHHEQMLELAREQWQAALHAEEHRRTLDHYALRVLPGEILPVYQAIAARNDPLPLLILLSPPALAADGAQGAHNLPSIEKRLTNRLRTFLDSYASDGTHAVRFLGGAWRSKASYGEAAVHGLHRMLPSIPTLVLESEVEGGSLSFRFAYWGLGEEDFTYRSVLPAVDIRALLRQFARETATRWRDHRAPHSGTGHALVPVAAPGSVDEANQRALQLEVNARELGLDVWEQDYTLDERHYARLEQFLTAWHCLVAAWIADAYHLFHGRAAPRLPTLLPSLIPDLLDEQLVTSIVTGYGHLYNELGSELEHWMPELQAELAKGLGHLADKRWALRLARRSVRTWLALRGVPAADDAESLSSMEQVVVLEDEPYLGQLRDAFAAAGRPELAQRIGRVLEDWRERRQRGEIPRDHGGDTVYGAFKPR